MASPAPGPVRPDGGSTLAVPQSDGSGECAPDPPQPPQQGGVGEGSASDTTPTTTAAQPSPPAPTPTAPPDGGAVSSAKGASEPPGAEGRGQLKLYSDAAKAAALVQADPAACTLEIGGLASPTSKIVVQIFRVNHPTKVLRLDKEDGDIQALLNPSGVPPDTFVVDVKTLGNVSFGDIGNHMNSFKPHCVHFMGHGTEERLVLVDKDGLEYGAAEIATLFEGQPQCFLAVFNCCLSAPIARAVCEKGGVFLTIGTSKTVGDKAAVAFAKALWGSVLLNPVGTAFTQARLSGPYHIFQGSNPPSPLPPTESPPRPPPQPAPADHIQLLQTRLKEQYTSAAFTNIRVLDFAKNTAIQLEEIYTRLAIVDAAAQQVREAGEEEIESRADLAVEFDTLYSPKQPSHIDHLFGKDEEPTSRVLVVGRAGIGKTTLSRKIAHLWATGHPPLASRFDLVFRIALRGKVEDQGSIEELLHAVCLGSPRAFTLEQLDAALEQAGPRVLLLLDGYDEFQAESCPFLHRLIEGKRDPGFSVLITSRPAATQLLMRSSSHHPFFAFDDVFELLGFSTAAITEYVGKYFAAKPDTAAGMVAYLEAHPTVQGAARVPIVAALLCILYESHEERGQRAGELPSTLTGIFREMAKYLLGRARQRPKFKSDGGQVQLQAGLEFLEALAWEGMQQGRILFSEEQFEPVAQPPYNVERATLELALELGILTPAELRHHNEPVARVDYHFLHLTLQEFLAARHLQRGGRLQAEAGAERVVFADRQSLWMVWQFGCGLLGENAGDLLRTIVATVKKDKRQALLALQCQAESGCPELVGLLEGVFQDGRIDLSNSQLGAVELAAVVDVAKRFEIRVLDLSGNTGLGASDADLLGPALLGKRAPGEVHVSSCGVAFIARLVHLGATRLHGGEVEMEGARRFAQAWKSDLVKLNLSALGLWQAQGLVVAKALQGNNTLTTIDLSGNHIGSEAGVVLAEALRGNVTLTSLDLGSNKLGPEAGAALAEALRGNTTLTTLNLWDNDLGPEAGAALAEALKGNVTLTSLNLGGNNLGPEAGMALVEALKGNTTLTSLDLNHNHLGAGVGAALATALQSNTSITQVDISDHGLNESGKTALAQLLRGNASLTALDLSGQGLGATGGGALAEALKGNTLTTLDLGGNKLGPEAGLALAEALKGNTLTTLDLSSNIIGPEAGLALAEALKGNTTLTTLNLWNNKLGPEGGTALAEALKGNTALTILDLSSNIIGPEAGLALAEALKGNTTLATLNLWNNKLGPEGGTALAEALQGNTSLTSLSLQSNKLGARGGAALAEALKGNTALTTLNLSRNQLGLEGGAALAKALKGNTTLASLNLSWNGLVAEAGMALAKALKGNNTLTNLNLSWNELGPEAGVALAEALRGNTTLTSLSLQSNNLGPGGGAALAKALRGNTTPPTTLNLGSNEFGPQAVTELKQALEGTGLFNSDWN